jgi:CRISPR-associated protein Cas1
MRPLLNTLYVTLQGSYLSREGDTVAVRHEDMVKLRIPVRTLQGVVCFGQVSCSSFFMSLCSEYGVGISFMTEYGRFLARVQGPISGNVLLRKQQYRASDSPSHTVSIARAVVMGKIANSRTVLLRAARERDASPAREALEHGGLRLFRILSDVEKAPSVDEVRGYEGDAARTYFALFDHLIVAGKDEFMFSGRSRRPPLDNVNALLSFLYTLLTHDTASALEGSGLDPAVGFLHRDRPGRPSLALDLVEELRPVLADRLALSLINRRQISGADFHKTETGGIVLTDAARKEVLIAWQKRKQEEVIHPFTGEAVPLGLFPHLQAVLLARHLRGDLDGYPPLIWR